MLPVQGCSMIKTPSFYVDQGLTLDCVPAAIAMAVNNNYHVQTGKVGTADIKYALGTNRVFWNHEDAIEALQIFDFKILNEPFDGNGQAIVFTTVATGIGHAVYVKNNVVYDSLGVFGKKVYKYEELETRTKIIKFDRFSSNDGNSPRLLHNQ